MAARDGEGGPEDIRDTAPQCIAAGAAGASLAAEGVVVDDRAVADRGRAAPRTPVRLSSVSCEPTTEALAHQGADGVAGAADGAVMADRNVAGDQDNGRRTPSPIEDPTAAAAADFGAEDARVAAASQCLVELERTARDRGQPDIDQAPAGGAAASASSVVGAPDGLVMGEVTSVNDKDRAVGIHDATADGLA